MIAFTCHRIYFLSSIFYVSKFRIDWNSNEIAKVWINFQPFSVKRCTGWRESTWTIFLFLRKSLTEKFVDNILYFFVSNPKIIPNSNLFYEKCSLLHVPVSNCSTRHFNDRISCVGSDFGLMIFLDGSSGAGRREKEPFGRHSISHLNFNSFSQRKSFFTSSVVVFFFQFARFY